MSQAERFAAPGSPIGVANMSNFFRLLQCQKTCLLHLVLLARFVLIIAGVGAIDSHTMPGGDRRICALLLLAFPLFSRSSNTGGTSKQRDNFSVASSSL